MTKLQVAVVGLGTMGAGMARSLLRNGHDVRVWNRTPDKAAPLVEAGAIQATSVAEAVTTANIIITMLFDADAVLDVAGDITEAARPDAIWMQCSTIGVDVWPELSRRCGTTLRLIDAPVLGTKQPAENGALVVLAAGPADAVAEAAPVFDAIGNRLVSVGPEVGQASALKLVCNSWLATLTAGAAQGIALAEALGLDPQLFLDTIQGGTQDAPYLQRKGAQMIAGTYPEGFGVAAALKDVALAQQASSSVGVPTELLDALSALLHRAVERSDGHDDVAAIRRAFDASTTR